MAISMAPTVEFTYGISSPDMRLEIRVLQRMIYHAVRMVRCIRCLKVRIYSVTLLLSDYVTPHGSREKQKSKGTT